MSAKYIVYKCGADETPVIFPEWVQHKDMKLETEWVDCHPISGGFVSMDKDKVEVHGFSKSLELKTRPEDALLLKKLLTSM